jgi:hypothetical protein
MRALFVAAALLATVPAAAQQHQHGQAGQQQPGQHAHGAAGAHEHPAGVAEGWEVRLDRPGPLTEVRFMEMQGHQHAILGPSAIFYRAGDVATGTYRLSATFRQNKRTNHPEAYGLLLGGRDLAGDGQDYLYFVIRQDGKFLVKHRAGAETHTLIDWTEHAPVRAADADGRAVNALRMDVGEGGVRFLVNDTEVGSIPRVSHLNTDGVYGLRINHGVDVRVDGLSLQR